ncbi:MAG: type II secretion system secretin GspD [Thermodesulfobacteriota bacterium]
MKKARTDKMAQWLTAGMAMLLLLAAWSPCGAQVGAIRTAPPASAQNDAIAIDFNNVDILVFVKYISELTGRNFVIDSAVKGMVTVISATPVSATEAYRIFESVLEVHGFAAVPTGDIVKIVPAGNAREKNVGIIDAVTGREGDDRLATQIVRLEHSSPAEVKNLLLPMMAKTSMIADYPAGRMLIITDAVSNLARLNEIIRQLDVEDSGRELQVLPLKHAAAASVAKTVQSVFAAARAAADKGAGKGPEDEVKIVPYERTNVLIVFAAKEDADNIRALVRVLDEEQESGEGNVHVCYLQNANAEELAKVLASLPEGAPAGKENVKLRTFSDEVRILPDKATNSLVITADRNDYQAVLELVRQLDIPRRMVYIEALIMEVNMEKDFRLGVEWLNVGKTDLDTRSGGVIGGFSGSEPPFSAITGLSKATLPAGFSMGVFSEAITIGEGDSKIVFPNVGALLQAYKKDSDIHILSTPQILTTDNEEAKIHVGENIPYLTKDATTTGDQVYQLYEYRDVGVTLQITPQINQDGQVRMKIFQEVVKLKETSDEFRPSTLKRSAETTVIVNDGNTVVIGGIIGDDNQITNAKVPLLGDIPLLGNLFRFRIDRRNRTNLFVFLSPHVIANPSESAAFSLKKKADAAVKLESIENSGLLAGDSGTTLVAQLDAKGYENLEAGNLDEAASYYTKALALDENDPLALLNLGVIHQRRGQYDEAAAMYRRVIALDTTAVAAQSTDPANRGRNLADIARDNLAALPEAGRPDRNGGD